MTRNTNELNSNHTSARNQRHAQVIMRAWEISSHFRKDERGSLIIFSLFIFVLVLMAGGMAVDIMRYESVRTNIQNTIDRAVLAAADLDQVTEAQAVVDDYFLKAGLSMYNPVTEDDTDSLTYSTVTTTATANVPTMFMNRMGINYLPAVARSKAQERVSDIEISLVLDTSGSMGSNNRLVNMKAAAKDFVDTVFDGAEAGTLTISMVPYNTQVNVGEGIMTRLERTNPQPYLYCATFVDSDYNTTALPIAGNVDGDSIIQTSHVDMQSQYKSWDDTGKAWNSWQMNCPTSAALKIMPFADDPTTIKTRIDGLSAGGWTSIDLGVKWGAAMLDPSFQTVLNGLIADGDVDGAHAGKPAAFTGNSTLKVLVVMSDGANTKQFYLPPEYGSGPSNVFVDDDTGDLFVFKNSNGCKTKTESNCWFSAEDKGRFNNPGRGGTSTTTYRQMDYVELWHTYNSNYVAYLYGEASVNNWTKDDWDATFYNEHTETIKDTRMDAICTKAKDKGIVVFTIGFEMSDSDALQMFDCASSESHFFRAAGSQLQTAFAEIANKISQLRLVQ